MSGPLSVLLGQHSPQKTRKEHPCPCFARWTTTQGRQTASTLSWVPLTKCGYVNGFDSSGSSIFINAPFVLPSFVFVTKSDSSTGIVPSIRLLEACGFVQEQWLVCYTLDLTIPSTILSTCTSVAIQPWHSPSICIYFDFWSELYKATSYQVMSWFDRFISSRVSWLLFFTLEVWLQKLVRHEVKLHWVLSEFVQYLCLFCKQCLYIVKDSHLEYSHIPQYRGK